MPSGEGVVAGVPGTSFEAPAVRARSPGLELPPPWRLRQASTTQLRSSPGGESLDSMPPTETLVNVSSMTMDVYPQIPGPEARKALDRLNESLITDQML